MQYVLAFILFIFVIILFAYLIFSIISELSGAPFVPSKGSSVRQMLDLAQIEKDEKLIDLGSGDGRIVFEATKYGIDAWGVDINAVLIIFSKLKSYITKNNNAHFEYKNIFNVDLTKFDVVTLYCLPKTINKLEDKLRKELKPSARIISNTFDLKNAQIIKQEGKIRVYQFTK